MILSVCPNPSVDTFANIDAILPAEVNRIDEEFHFPGGKGVHVALALAEMQIAVSLFAFWGGPTGEWIQQKCQKHGVKPTGVAVTDWNRNCYTFKSENPTYDETEILGAGPVISKDEEMTYYQEYKNVVKHFDIVTMSGSWPKGSSKRGYRQLINQSGNAKVFLDCTGQQFKNALNTRPFGIHLNANEAKELLKTNNPKQAAVDLLQYCSLAAITAGKDGLYLAVKTSGVIHANVDIPECKSAVGSGDCLLAGLALATHREYNIEDTARLGVACGAANCLRDDLGMLYKKDVDRLFQKVKISQLTNK